jgi:predicted double-glycine peptidase
MTLIDPPCSPICLQETPYSCSAATLRSVLAQLNDVEPEARLRQIIGVTDQGANAMQIVQAARQLGYQAQIVICGRDAPAGQRFRPALAELGALANRGLMPITQTKSWTLPGKYHFIVVCSVTAQGVLCMDPRVGYRFCPHAEWYDYWHMQTGDRLALVIRPPRAAGIGDLAHYRDDPEEPFRLPGNYEAQPLHTTRDGPDAATAALRLHRYLKSAKVDGDGVVVRGPGGWMYLRAILYDPEVPDIKLVPDRVDGLRVEIVIKARSSRAGG